MKKYIINEDTIALIKKNNSTLIIEDKRKLLITKKLLTILDESCKFYGSNYKGRITAISELINSKYKTPILINEISSLIFFPTGSLRNENVMYFNYKKIIKYDEFYGIIRIYLSNNIMLTSKISKYSLNEQLLKCLLINNILYSRKNRENL